MELMASAANKLHKLGILTEVLARSAVFQNEEGKNLLLLETGAFEYDIVQETLKNKTLGMEGHQRARGHTQWLRSAFSNGALWRIAEAIEYTAGRIRNEAGIYRRGIYEFLATSLHQVIVESLNQPNEEKSGAAARIADKIEEMLQNDLSRRDTVSRLGSFKSLPFQTIQQVAQHGALSCDPAPRISRDDGFKNELRALFCSVLRLFQNFLQKVLDIPL